MTVIQQAARQARRLGRDVYVATTAVGTRARYLITDEPRPDWLYRVSPTGAVTTPHKETLCPAPSAES